MFLILLPFLASGAPVLGKSIFVSQVKNQMARDICVTSCPSLRSPYPRCAVIPYMLIVFTGVDTTSWNGGYMGCGPSLGAADWLGTLPTAKTSVGSRATSPPAHDPGARCDVVPHSRRRLREVAVHGKERIREDPCIFWRVPRRLVGHCASGESIWETACVEESYDKKSIKSFNYSEIEKFRLYQTYYDQNYDQNFTYACFALLGSRGRRRFATLHGLRRAHRRFYVTRVQGGQRDPRTGWSLCPAGKPADAFRKPAVRKPAVRKPAVYMADPGDDKRPPSWNGTGGRVVQELYIRYAEGHIRGLSDLDRDRGCVRLWRGLQGVAAVRMEEADLGRLTAEKAEGELASGWLYFLAQLNEKFPETALRQLPRVYRGFFNDVVWRGDMETLILDIEKAASLLEGFDTDTKVSDGMCGYWTLLRSRLADGEVKHIIGLAGGQLKLSRIRTRLTELYPRGSYKRDGHRSYLADEDESWLADQYGGGWDELDDAWVPDDDGGFYDADEDGLAAWEQDSSWQGGSWPESRTTRGWRPRSSLGPGPQGAGA